MSTQAPKVFISYRREETAGHAGRLYDAMAAQFGEPNVFMDVEMEPGIDFVERITEVVGACHVLLVVMGPKWATLEGARGQARLAESQDFVRLEVETALDRADVTVIPLLVAGAHMPQPEELPERLHAITRRNALELSDVRWRYDVGRLESTLAQLLRGQTGVHEVVTEREPRTPSVAQTVIEVLVVAAAAGALGGLLSRLVDPSSPDEAGRVVKTIAQQALTWVPVGAALAIWFSVWRGERRSTVARAGTGLVAGALAGAVGGAIYSVGVYLPGDYSDATTRSFRLLAVTAIGAVVGVFVGRLWSPSGWRGAAGLLAGAGGGALAQAIVNSSFRGDGTWHSVFAVGFRSFVIVGLVIGTLLALDALEGGAPLERPG